MRYPVVLHLSYTGIRIVIVPDAAYGPSLDYFKFINMSGYRGSAQERRILPVGGPVLSMLLCECICVRV